MIPAVNRLGIKPVGVFNLAIGPETPAIYVLLPSATLETLVTLEARLAQDAEYVKTGAAFLNAPAIAPAFNRIESSLMIAFEKIPGLTLPAATATNGPRVFELRTYESATDQDHKRKVEMMQSGEEAIFAKAGFSQVFYGDTLDRSALAEPYVHAQLREHRGARQGVVGVRQRTRMEGHASPAALRLREHRLQHHQRHSDAGTVFADIVRCASRSRDCPTAL